MNNLITYLSMFNFDIIWHKQFWSYIDKIQHLDRYKNHILYHVIKWV